MNVSRFCVRHVVKIHPTAMVSAAAQYMANENIGALVVVDDVDKPVGILTDRDIVVRALAKGQAADQTEVNAVMTPTPVCIGEDAPLGSVLEKMKFYRLRRLIVVNTAQEVVGIISLDDIFDLIVEEREAFATVTETLRATRYEKR